MSKVLSPILGVFGAIASFVPGFQWAAPIFEAGSIGLGYLVNRKKGAAPTPISIAAPPPPMKVAVDLPVVPRVISYGRVRSGGIFFCKEAGAGKGVLVYGLYLCDGPIAGMDSIICDDEYVGWIQAVSNSPSAPDPTIVFQAPSGTKKLNSGYGASVVLVEVASATEQGRQSYLLSTFCASGSMNGTGVSDPTITAIWDNTHLGKGITAVYAWAFTNQGSLSGWGVDRRSLYPNNWPVYNFVYRGAPVYDPRAGSQSQNDPVTGKYSLYNSSWKWSENPALIAADYVNRLIQQGALPLTGINWASIAEAANDCDVLVPCVRYSFGDGGTCYEPFARMTANISLELEPRDVLAKIMAVCDGSYGVDQNGQFTMWIGKWEDPRVIFTDSDISGVREDFGPTLAEETNYLNITYPDPRMNCDMVQAPIYQDTDSIAKVGRRIDTMQLEYCPSPSQAWRMARRYLMRINRRRRITLRLNARGMMAIGQRYIGISAATFQIYGTFRLLQVYPGENLAEWNVDLVEVAKDIFDDPMCPTDPIHDLPIVQPSGTPATPAPPLPNLSTYYDAASGNYRVRIDWAPQSYATWWSSAQNLLLPDPNYVYTAIYSTVGDPLSGGVPVFDVNARLSDFTLLTPPFPKGTTVWVLVSYVPLQYTKAGPYSLSASIKI